MSFSMRFQFCRPWSCLMYRLLEGVHGGNGLYTPPKSSQLTLLKCSRIALRSSENKSFVTYIPHSFPEVCVWPDAAG